MYTHLSILSLSIYIYTYTHTVLCMFMCVNTYMHIYIYIYIHIYLYLSLSISLSLYIYIYIYIYIYLRGWPLWGLNASRDSQLSVYGYAACFSVRRCPAPSWCIAGPAAASLYHFMSHYARLSYITL